MKGLFATLLIGLAACSRAPVPVQGAYSVPPNYAGATVIPNAHIERTTVIPAMTDMQAEALGKLAEAIRANAEAQKSNAELLKAVAEGLRGQPISEPIISLDGYGATLRDSSIEETGDYIPEKSEVCQ